MSIDPYNTYYDSAKGARITKDQARREICQRHGHPAETFADFLQQAGDHPEYDAQAVLDFLGY